MAGNESLLGILSQLSGGGNGQQSSLTAGNTGGLPTGLTGRENLSGLDSFLGNKDFSGWGMPAIQGILGGIGAYSSLKNLGLAEDQFNFQKSAYSTDLNNQATLVNGQMADSASARYNDAGGANNPNNPYATTADYMAKNQVKTKI